MMPKKKQKKVFKNISFIFSYIKNTKSVAGGLIFAGLFSMVFYVVAISTDYLPIKFPAAIPFLVLNQDSNITNLNGGLLDDIVIEDTPVDGDSIDVAQMDYSSKLVQLDNKIKDAGIPIDGVALLQTDTFTTRIDFRPEATEEQKLQARQIADSFDWKITYKDIFEAQKAKDAIMQQYPPEKLAGFSSQLSLVNYFLDHKEFSKLKGFLNGLYLQNIITQDDYMLFADILADQKIYLNPNFEAPAENNPVETPSTETPPIETTPVSTQEPAQEPAEATPVQETPAEETVLEPEPDPAVETPVENHATEPEVAPEPEPDPINETPVGAPAPETVSDQ